MNRNSLCCAIAVGFFSCIAVVGCKKKETEPGEGDGASIENPSEISQHVEGQAQANSQKPKPRQNSRPKRQRIEEHLNSPIVAVRSDSGTISPGLVVDKDVRGYLIACFFQDGYYGSHQVFPAEATIDLQEEILVNQVSKDAKSDFGYLRVEKGLSLDLDLQPPQERETGEVPARLVWLRKEVLEPVGGTPEEITQAREERDRALTEMEPLERRIEAFNDMAQVKVLERFREHRLKSRSQGKSGSQPFGTFQNNWQLPPSPGKLATLGSTSYKSKFRQLYYGAGELDESDQDQIVLLLGEWLEIKSRLDQAKLVLIQNERYTTKLVESAAIARIEADGSLQIPKSADLAQVESSSAVVLSQEGDILGLIRLPDKNARDNREVAAMSYPQLAGNVRSWFENAQVALAIEDGDFESADVRLEMTANANLGIEWKNLYLTVGLVSGTELVDQPDGSQIIRPAGSPRRSSGFSQKSPGQPWTALSDLGIKGQQGTFRFRGQAYVQCQDRSAIQFPVFEFSVSHYKSRPSTLRLDTPAGVQEYAASKESPNRNYLETSGTILSVSKANRGEWLCVQTDAPSLRLLDLNTQRWIDGGEIPIRTGARAVAGAAGIFVYYPAERVLERWNAERREKEIAGILTLPGELIGLAAPEWADDRPLFVVTSEGPYFVDSESLELLDLKLVDTSYQPANDENWEQRLARRHFRPITRASGDGGLYLFTTVPGSIEDDPIAPLLLVPDAAAGVAQLREARGMALGYSGAITYYSGRGNEINENESERFSQLATLFPDSCWPGVVAGISERNYHYVPPKPVSVQLYVDGDYDLGAKRRNPAILASLGDIFELSKELNGPDEMSLWERAIFAAGPGVFVAIPPERDGLALYRRDVAKDLTAYSEGEPSIISYPPSAIALGKEFEHPIRTSGNVSDLILIEGPPGAELNSEGTLTWNTGNAIVEEAAFTIEAVFPSGDSRVEEYKVPILGQRPMIANTKEGQVEGAVRVDHRRLNLPGRPRQIFTAASGKLLCVLYADLRQLDVFNMETEAVHLSLSLGSSDVQGVANHHSIYLYSAEQKLIERISLDNPDIRTQIPAQGEIVALGTGPNAKNLPIVSVEKLASKVIASETRVIGNRKFTMSRSSSGGVLIDLLHSTKLTPMITNYDDELLEAFNTASSASWREFGILPATSEGNFILLPPRHHSTEGRWRP